MKAGISTLSDLADGAAALGGVIGAGGNHYYVDPNNGSDGNDGLSPKTAKASLETAYAMTTSGQNDVVFFIGGASAFNPTAAFDFGRWLCDLKYAVQQRKGFRRKWFTNTDGIATFPEQLFHYEPNFTYCRRVGFENCW